MYDPGYDREEQIPDPNRWVKKLARLFGKGLAICAGIVALVAVAMYSIGWAWAWGKFIAPFVLVGVVVWVLYMWADSVTPEED